MTMAASTLITALTNLWTSPPESRSYQDTADAIEDLWLTAVVGAGLSSATVFTPGITYNPLSPVGSFSSAVVAAVAFESACSAMVAGTTFTPVPPVTVIAVPPFPVAAQPGTLIAALLPIFSAPQSGTSASTQASLIGTAIYTYLFGWQVLVTTPPSSPVATPIV